MITASAFVKDVLEQNTTITQAVGCTLELNMNSMVDNLNITASEYTVSGSQPYKKLFPADSIVKTFRPIGAGIKYAVSNRIGTYGNPKAIEYPFDYRVYYAGSDTYYKYWLSPSGGGSISISYPQAVLTNKIVLKFEISHSLPTSWSVSTNLGLVSSGSNNDLKAFTTFGNKNYDAGSVSLYYDGSSWSRVKPNVMGAPVSITSLSLTTIGADNVGVIELSPRVVYDISDKIMDFNISKESSTSADDILPVGKVTANSLSLQMVSYETPRQVLSFIKGDTFNSSNIYLFKNAEITPFYKIYYTGAPSVDSKGTYEKIPQGTFYIDSWTTSEYGDISITALDAAKFLQDTIAPNIFCQDFSATAILRRLLDSVGFNNYNMNIKKDTNGNIIDTSIFSPKYWWTDDGKTVWNAVQEICRDSQMTAVVDENNVLQFYTRDYLFDNSRPTAWTFRYDPDGSKLANIISFTKQDLSTANVIKVLWRTQNSSETLGNAQPLWKAEDSYIGAFALNQNLFTTAGTGSYINISPVIVNQLQKQVLYSYSGYLVVDSEIIEYDAIEYQYLSKSGQMKYLDVTNTSDLQKVYNDISPSTDINYMLKQSGKVRIKTRGAFGTNIENHYADARDILSSWAGYEVGWSS